MSTRSIYSFTQYSVSILNAVASKSSFRVPELARVASRRNVHVVIYGRASLHTMIQILNMDLFSLCDCESVLIASVAAPTIERHLIEVYFRWTFMEFMSTPRRSYGAAALRRNKA
jgi:hypothetical protein